MNWVSTRESLPGFDKQVFVYCVHTGKIAGPVYLLEHKGTEIDRYSGFEQNLATGERFDKFKGTGIYACAWFQGSMVFTSFMPTHWT